MTNTMTITIEVPDGARIETFRGLAVAAIEHMQRGTPNGQFLIENNGGLLRWAPSDMTNDSNFKRYAVTFGPTDKLIEHPGGLWVRFDDAQREIDAAHSRGFAEGSGNEGEYQREIARLKLENQRLQALFDGAFT